MTGFVPAAAQGDEGSPARRENSNPELAAVVLAVGAPPELRTAVMSLLEQSVPLEIVIVNSGGGDPYAVLPNGGVGMKVISLPERIWPGAARNLGIRSSRAPWVAFLASDLIAKPDWAAARLEFHKQGRSAVGSAVVNSHPRNLFAWASHVSVLVRRLPKVPRREALPYGASYSRELFERYGYFREDLRIGEDTEFNGRLNRSDRPVWAPAVQAIHTNPTTFRRMVSDQFARGCREGLHWTAPKEHALPTYIYRRFMRAAPLSLRAVRGVDRLFVVASWPLVLLCACARELGIERGRRKRAEASAAVAILDRDDWSENTDIIVVADARAKRLTWVPRDLWSARLKDRVNRAFALGGGGALLTALSDLGFPVRGLVCLRRSASEAALHGIEVTVPVPERLDFWYPLHPSKPIEEGKKAISFEPPEETLSGERIHQWIGARTEIHGAGSDLLRLRRQQVLVRALLSKGFDFRRALEDPELVRTFGQRPLEILAKVRPDWNMVLVDAVKDAMIDGKAVLVQRRTGTR